MRLYAGADGALIRVLKTAEDEQQYGAPTNYADALEIDADTNPQIILLIDTAWNDVWLSGGVLTYRGQALTINPPGIAWQAQADSADAKARILAAIDRAIAAHDAALASWATLTAAQQKTVLKRLVEIQTQILRYHRRELL